MPSGRPLTAKERDKLFRVWMDIQSVRLTARKSHVSDFTVKKYMKLDNWYKRREDILVKAQQKGDDRTVYKLTNELNALHVFIQHHIKQLAELLKNNEVRATVPALLQLIEGKRELLKEVEPEVTVLPESDKVVDVFNRLTEDAARELAEAAAAQLNKANDDKT